MASELAVSPALGGIAVAIVIVAVGAGVAGYRERHRPAPPDPLEVSEQVLVAAVLASPDAHEFAELGEDEVRTLVSWLLQSLRVHRAPGGGRRAAAARRRAASRQGLRVGRAELVAELLTRGRTAGSPLEAPAVHALVATAARLLEQGLDTPPPRRSGPMALPLGELGLPGELRPPLAPPEVHPPGSGPSEPPRPQDQRPPGAPVT